MSRLKFLSLCFFIIASTAHGESGMYTYDALPASEQTIQLQRALAASFRITPGPCTSTAISNDGYVITAAHCVDRILSPETFGNPPPELESFVYGGPFKTNGGIRHFVRRTGPVNPTDPFQPDPLSLYDLDWNRTQFLSGNNDTEVKLIALGSGNVFLQDGIDYDKMTEKTAAQIGNLKQDIAIVKFKLPHPVQCVRLGEGVNENERVTEIGYGEVRSRRHNPRDSENDKYIFFGTATRTPEKVEAFLSEKPRTQNLYAKIFLANENFIADTDASPGCSGGAVLNTQGELVGVTSSILDSDTTHYHRYNTAMVGVQVIKKAIATWVPLEEQAKVTDCHPL